MTQTAHDAHAIHAANNAQNRVKSMRKLPNGDMLCFQYSGNTFTLKPTDEVFQAFVVFAMIDNA